MLIYSALLLPFDRSGEIDVDALRTHTCRIVDSGVDGLAVLGTMGEFPDLSTDERRTVNDAVIEAAAGRVPVMVGVGATGTREACAHARAAAALGADELMVLPPLYWKLGSTQLVAHFAKVAEASSVPCLVYDIPALSGTSISADVMRTLARTVPGISGVKLSDNDLGKINAGVRIKHERPDFRVFVGHRDLLLAGFVSGADGAIAELTNIAPGAHLALRDAVRAGDLARAGRLQRAIQDLGRLATLAQPSLLPLKVATNLAVSDVAPITRTPAAEPDRVIEDAAELTRSVFAEHAEELGALRSQPAGS